ncbi:gasdermin Eb [Boleophthalmus pectinirostris]|uniref:gasdermin Eb n=1 Tax=Boleophthalmus pectinirostris TaxID=150288 RepID=UPI002430352F|nr:gasdermin Eb [Boleophthalmus pectinirostris]XP_020793188.2 gasdermin Eb [Boleophthalmus pectinirostris]
MFATATRNFVEEVDRGRSLIPVSSLNDTISLLTVVIKKKRYWLWQKPKYLPTDFTLNDILAGGTPIQPDITESEFIKYNGTFGDNIQGNVGANFIQNNVSVEGKDTSKLQSSFGSLKKEELGMPKLIKDSKERLLDMSHCLVEQTMRNNKQVFGIVKERILTTQPCSVIEEVQKEGQFGGMLTVCGAKVTKVSLKENASLSKDSNVTMEIPPHTTLAYALIELEVKHDGHFKLCLMSTVSGGFEEVDSNGRLAPLHHSEKVDFRPVLEEFKEYFKVLSALPSQTKSSLLLQITEVIDDRTALSLLQNSLHHLCYGGVSASVEEHQQQIQDILDLVAQSGASKDAVIKALHLVLSAVDEMSNKCLALLRMCCSSALLPDLELLVQCLLGDGQLPLTAMRQTTLEEEVFDRVQCLFSSSNVFLKKDGDSLRTEVQQEAGNLPIILCIALRGLASLSQ